VVNIIRKIIRPLGVDLVRYPYRLSSTNEDYNRLLANNNIDLIFDVGANIGQYASETLKYGYSGKIISFEPMSKEHAILLEKSKDHPQWKVASQMAIGNEDGFIEINISENSESSSILDLKDYTLANSPTTKFVGKEKVRISKVDSIYDQYAEGAKNVFLKIDVQGYEEHVLKGASDALKKIRGLHLEFSLIPLYKEEKTMLDILKIVYDYGFEPNYFIPHTTIDSAGRLMQIDGIFFRV
jgi:FkbM family methyltransferase